MLRLQPPLLRLLHALEPDEYRGEIRALPGHGGHSANSPFCFAYRTLGNNASPYSLKLGIKMCDAMLVSQSFRPVGHAVGLTNSYRGSQKIKKIPMDGAYLDHKPISSTRERGRASSIDEFKFRAKMKIAKHSGGFSSWKPRTNNKGKGDLI